MLPSLATIYGTFALPFGELRLPKTLPSAQIKDASSNNTVATLSLALRGANYTLSGEDVYIFDFSNFKTAGTYYAYVPGIGKSYNFTIGNNALDKVSAATWHYLYYAREGIAKTAPYAESRFARNIDHEFNPSGRMIDAAFHESILNSPLYNNEVVCPLGIEAPNSCPPGSMVDMTGGWMDAGDYGKYVTSAAYPVWISLTGYELNPSKFLDNWNIPESGNGTPDILDEVRWETDWLAKMMDSNGGVYNKVVGQSWESGTMDNSNLGGQPVRYIMEKTTYDTANVTAIMASFSRILKNINPTLSASYLEKARKGWEFLEAHPDPLPSIGFKNPPGTDSGEFPEKLQKSGTINDRDNRAWAAAELYRATDEAEFNTEFISLWNGGACNTSGQDNGNFYQNFCKEARWAYIKATGPDADQSLKSTFIADIIKDGDDLLLKSQNNVYKTGARLGVPERISWGMLGGAGPEFAFTLLLANNLSPDQKYVDAAYIDAGVTLGLNPLSRAFITGMGGSNPKDPLHMQSYWDNVDDPVPGYVVFGPVAHILAQTNWTVEAQSNRNNYPSLEQGSGPYPILRRWADEFNIVEYNEGGIVQQASSVSYYLLKP